MSKSLGNGIDPIEVIDKYGADSLRFSVLSGTTMGNDIKYMPEKLEQASNFANKIWNAAKFVTMNAAEDEKIIEFSKNIHGLRVEDKWIINKLNTLIKEVTENIESYDLGIALDKIYSFMWDEFCDWYIEIAKTRFNENNNEKIVVSYVLDYVFRNSLKLLHPFMPFVTAEIYSKLVNYDNKDIMISEWPKESKETYNKEEEFIESLKNIIVQIRNIRTNMNIHPSKKVKLIAVVEDKEVQKYLDESKEYLKKLGFGNEVIIQENLDGIESNAICASNEEIKIYMPFSELIDIEEEKKRLLNEKERLEKEVERSKKILENKGFLAKAPKEKVEEEKEKLEKYVKLLEETENNLKRI